MRTASLLLVLLAASATACAPSASPCATTVPPALQTCVAAVSERQATCYNETGQACAADDAGVLAALDGLEAEVEGVCVEGDVGRVEPEALPGRFRRACRSEAEAVAWRAFGGRHGAAWDAASSSERTCLQAAHDVGAQMLTDGLAAVSDCHLDETCDAATLGTRRDALVTAAAARLQEDCPTLAAQVALDPATLVERAAGQVDCLAAAALGGVDELGLTCGPAHARIDAPRDTWTEIVVDGETWGTRCGDGSEFAFWLRPAPEGAPLDRVVVALQGGGVCLFEEDCAPRLQAAPFLFDARGDDDVPQPLGIASDDPTVSPFHDWTMVYVPYCNQDVFAGGGVSEALGEVVVERYGAVNLRAAVRMVRDWLWRELDEAGAEGFRSDRVTALFGGFSAGGYGTLYNYPWFLDELLWPRTAAFPDAGLAVDNGELLGVGALGAVKIPAWGMREYLPGYCFEGPCSGGQTLLEAVSPRLLEVPEQQMVLLSNQRDSTQAGDAFFPDDASFLNAMRQMYCDTRDLPGIHWYLSSVSDESVHVISLRDELFTGEVDGGILGEVLFDAMTEPEALRSHVEEADFVEAVPGVEPFPCDL